MNSQPPLGKAPRAILALHVVLALGLGIAGLLDISGSDGMAGLARVVVLLLVGVWLVGVVASGLLARFAMAHVWLRIAVVSLGPVVALVGLVLFARA